MFHSAGNPNVELRLYSDAVYPQSYCQYCNNPAIPTNSQNQNHIRLQDIRDVLICINFENKGETSAIYEGIKMHIYVYNICIYLCSYLFA